MELIYSATDSTAQKRKKTWILVIGFLLIFNAAFYDKGGLVIINTNFKNGLLEESKERHKYLKGVKSVKKYKNGFLYSKNEEVDCDITPLYCTTKKVIDKWKKNKLFNSFFS